ncbi:MAG: hypothetical protein QM765_04530 [Myxococcales bacterium]
MRLVGWLAVLGIIGGIAYWFLVGAKPVRRDATTGQVIGQTAAPVTGGMDPATTMNNARNAAQRIQDDGLKRAADMDSKTSP